MKSWLPLSALALAQFVMVLDQAVMNVSISQLVDDFDTTVTTIQGVITLYSLVMAMFMLAGAKIGDIIGRRRAFVVGLVIYGIGSGLTAVSQSVAGPGARLVGPGGHRRGARAAGPGGAHRGQLRGPRACRRPTPSSAAWPAPASRSGPSWAAGRPRSSAWRVVFAGEVILVLVILALTRYVLDAPREGAKPRLDVLGIVLSASALGAIVLGILQASTWGLIEPTEASPITPLGFSLSIWMIARWRGPALRVRALAAPSRGIRPGSARAPGPVSDPVLRAGLANLLSMNLMLMGIFFVVPLYLQIVLGMDALETASRCCRSRSRCSSPRRSAPGSASASPVRTIIRAGLGISLRRRS